MLKSFRQLSQNSDWCSASSIFILIQRKVNIHLIVPGFHQAPGIFNLFLHNAFSSRFLFLQIQLATLLQEFLYIWIDQVDFPYNEGNNTLKNQGYYFDHNYGHAKKHLFAVVATLIVFLFLVHTVLRLVGQDGILAVQKEYYARKKCIGILRLAMEFTRVNTWEGAVRSRIKSIWEDVRNEIVGGWFLRERRKR